MTYETYNQKIATRKYFLHFKVTINVYFLALFRVAVFIIGEDKSMYLVVSDSING